MILPSAERVMSSRNCLESNPDSRAITSWLWSLHFRNITSAGEGRAGAVFTVQVSVGNCLEFVKYHQTESVDQTGYSGAVVVPSLPWEFGRTNLNMRQIIITLTDNSNYIYFSY